MRVISCEYHKIIREGFKKVELGFFAEIKGGGVIDLINKSTV